MQHVTSLFLAVFKDKQLILNYITLNIFLCVYSGSCPEGLHVLYRRRHRQITDIPFCVFTPGAVLKNVMSFIASAVESGT